jgi:DNA invertase Pin-like site-specific DNA recombinase
MATTQAPKRVAVYLRVSRLDQNPENQRAELERYVAFRGWQPTWFIEHGQSGAKDRRPELDAMLADVRRGKFDVVLSLKLDRLGRSLRHLVNLADDLQKLGVDLVTAADGIDTTTSHGRLMFGILGSIAEFERERLRERTFDGLAVARAAGKKFGRRPDKGLRRRVGDVAGLPVRKAAATLGCSPVTLQKLRKELAAAAAPTAPLLPLEAAR